MASSDRAINFPLRVTGVAEAAQAFKSVGEAATKTIGDVAKAAAAQAQYEAAVVRAHTSSAVLGAAQAQANQQLSAAKAAFAGGTMSAEAYATANLDVKNSLALVKAEQTAATAGLKNSSAALVAAKNSAAGLSPALVVAGRSAGATRAGFQQLGFQINDVTTQLSMGTPAMQVFAQQSGQVLQSVQLLSGGTGKFAALMGGPWGIALTAGISLLGLLGSKLFDTHDAMVEVKFATNAMGDAQGILGTVMDLTTGKINTQSQALLALARAQLLVAKVQSSERAAAARRAVLAIQDRPVEVSGGFGGGISAGRRPLDARDSISADVLANKLDPAVAVGRLDNVRKHGRMSDSDFAAGASAIANLAVEKANEKVYEEGLKLLNGTGGRTLLKSGRGTRGGGGARDGGAARGGGADTGKSTKDVERAFQTERAGIMSQYNSAMANAAQTAEEAADFEMRNLELQRIRIEHAINNNKDYDEAQKKTLIAQEEELAEVQRAQIEREKTRRLESEQEQAAQAEYQASRDALQIKLAMAGTEKDRQNIALELLEIDQRYRRNALEQIIASDIRTAAEKDRAQKALAGLGAVEGAERSVTKKTNQTSAEAYLRDLNRTPDQMNEALDQVKVNGLKSLNDGLVDAITNFHSLGDVAQNVLRSVLHDLVAMEVEKYVTNPLAKLLFPEQSKAVANDNAAQAGVELAAAGGEMIAAGGVLTSAATLWAAVATQIQLAAASLAASGGGAGGGGGGGGNPLGMLFDMAVGFATGGGGDLSGDVAATIAANPGVFAAGTDMLPIGKPFFVGENGREKMINRGGGRVEVINGPRTHRAAQEGGGGVTIVQNNYIPERVDPRRAADGIARSTQGAIARANRKGLAMTRGRN